jgi:hypothetical protein
MDPIQEGLTKYHNLNLPMGYAGGEQYILTGNMPVYPQSTVYRDGRPKGRGRPTKQVQFEAEGGVNISDVKKNAKKVGKKAVPVAKAVAPAVLDATFDLGAKALAVPLEELIGPVAPVATKVASQVARKALKNKIGYGEQTKVSKPQPKKRTYRKKIVENDDIGIYDGGLQKKKSNQPKKQAKPSNGVDKRKQRGEIVRRLIKEEGMSFGEASKNASKYMK